VNIRGNRSIDRETGRRNNHPVYSADLRPLIIVYRIGHETFTAHKREFAGESGTLPSPEKIALGLAGMQFPAILNDGLTCTLQSLLSCFITF